MRHVLIALLLGLAAPAAAQESDGAMERGLRLFMDGLRDEMEPALDDLGGLAQSARPLLERLQAQLGAVVDDLDAYAAPEILENGDILIRRKEPLATGEPGDAPEGVPPEEVEPNSDGSIDL